MLPLKPLPSRQTEPEILSSGAGLAAAIAIESGTELGEFAPDSIAIAAASPAPEERISGSVCRLRKRRWSCHDGGGGGPWGNQGFPHVEAAESPFRLTKSRGSRLNA